MKKPTILLLKQSLQLFMGIICIAPIASVYCQQGSRGVHQNSSFSSASGDVKASLSTLLHHTSNHEQELREIDEKFKNMEIIVDSLQKDFHSQNSKQKEVTKSFVSPIASKVSSLESENAQLKTELHEIKLRLNEYIQHFAQYKNHIDELQKRQKVQSENVELLQSSMKNLIDALQSPSSTVASSGVYEVKNGDSLGKIASVHKTSVKTIKELNNLTDETANRLTIGQKLKLP